MRPTQLRWDNFERCCVRWYSTWPTQVLLKLYQFSLIGLMIWWCWKTYDIFGETIHIFFYTYIFLNASLYIMQMERSVQRPSQSSDLINVTVIAMASVTQCIFNVIGVLFLFVASDNFVFEATWDYKDTIDEENRELLYKLTNHDKRNWYLHAARIFLLADLPHHVLWLAYLFVRFCPDLSSTERDVIIHPSSTHHRSYREMAPECPAICATPPHPDDPPPPGHQGQGQTVETQPVPVEPDPDTATVSHRIVRPSEQPKENIIV